MAWQKPAWRLYRIAGPTVAEAINRLPFGRELLRSWLRSVARRFLIASLPNPMNVKGLKLWWHPGAAFYAPEFFGGYYEEDTHGRFSSLLSRGMSVVDLGAHIGYFSLEAARCVGPSGRVYAFEPQPAVYSLLVKNIETNGYAAIVRPVRKAVSNTNGSVALFRGESDSGNASFYRTPGASVDRVVVETTTLDAFFAAEGWPTVHLVKMDIEGAEKVALEGMRELVARNPGLILIMEFSPDNQAAAGVTPQELFETLSALGFQKFSAIQGGLKPVSIPRDIPRLVRIAGDGYANLLCQR